MVEELTVIGILAIDITKDLPLDVIEAPQGAEHQTGTGAGEVVLEAFPVAPTVDGVVQYAAAHLLPRNRGPVAAYAMRHDLRSEGQSL